MKIKCGFFWRSSCLIVIVLFKIHKMKKKAFGWRSKSKRNWRKNDKHGFRTFRRTCIKDRSRWIMKNQDGIKWIKMVHQVICFSRFNKPWRLDVAIIIFGHLSSILEDEKIHSFADSGQTKSPEVLGCFKIAQNISKTFKNYKNHWKMFWQLQFNPLWCLCAGSGPTTSTYTSTLRKNK